MTTTETIAPTFWFEAMNREARECLRVGDEFIIDSRRGNQSFSLLPMEAVEEMKTFGNLEQALIHYVSMRRHGSLPEFKRNPIVPIVPPYATKLRIIRVTRSGARSGADMRVI